MRTYHVESIAGVNFTSSRDALYAAASEAACAKEPQKVAYRDDGGKPVVYATVIHGEGG